MAYYKSNVYAKAKAAAARPDRQKGQRMAFEKNKKKILLSQDICGICGQPVDKTLKWPHPYAATVDHIIPVSKGGHPSDIDNLQLAHNRCNRLKSDNLGLVQAPPREDKKPDVKTGRPPNKDLPLTINWRKYNTKNSSQLRKEILEQEKLGKTTYFEDI